MRFLTGIFGFVLGKNQASVKSSSGTFRKAVVRIHLWLGLASGIVVVILGLTGCILAFEREIRDLIEPEQFVQPQGRNYLPPGTLVANASRAIGGLKINYLDYPSRDRAALAYSYDATQYHLVALDPYDGRVLVAKDMNRDFFRIVLDGHFYLWLPPAIGQPIAGGATLIFLIMLITGLILWWPKNRSARKQRFTIKWNARWRRINYDLHNVLGFYMTWVAIFIAVTGLVMSFEWFAKGLYAVTSLGDALVTAEHPVSRLKTGPASNDAITRVWQQHLASLPANESISVEMPLSDSAAFEVSINHRPGTYYNMQTWAYDQHTGALLPDPGNDRQSFKMVRFADKVKRLNYDVHIGAALGITGKVIAFFASFIAASLPITGFLLWRGRHRKKTAAARVAPARKAVLQA